MKCRVLLFFCSNPEALGTDESEKGIFDALKNIAQLPPSLPRRDDQLVDSAAGPRESPAAEDVSKGSSAADTGESLEVIDLFSCRVLTHCPCVIQIPRLRTSRRALWLLAVLT